MRLLIVMILVIVSGFGQQSIPLSAPAPSGVTNVTVRRVGNPGAATYYYWVIASYAGGQGVNSVYGQVIDAANILSATNYNAVSWTPNPGPTAIAYDVLRTTTPSLPSSCTCALAIGLTTNVYLDQGAASIFYEYRPTGPITGQLVVDNTSSRVPFMDVGTLLRSSDNEIVAPTIDPTTSLYNWVSPTCAILTAGAGRILMPKPMPIGVAVGSYVYISGGVGTAEAALVTAIGADYLTVTVANGHSLCYSIGSATRGMQEAINVKGDGVVIQLPIGDNPVYATTTIVGNDVTIRGTGIGSVVNSFVSNLPTFYFNPAVVGSRNRIKDLRIVQVGAVGTSSGILIQRQNTFSLSNSYITGFARKSVV